MAIAFRSLTSTSYISRTNTVLTAPAGLADGDILIALVMVGRTSSTLAVTAATGFTEIGTPVDVNDPSGFHGMLHCYWKRAASESGSYTFTHGAQNSQGLLMAYSGALASGTPVTTTSINNGVGTSASGTGITTTAANSYLLFLAHNWEGSATLSPPTGMTEQFDGVVYSADQSIASAGATGNRAWTTVNVSTDPWTIRMVELLTAATADGTTLKVWTGSAWTQETATVWDGAAWIARPVKRWSGTAWV